MRHRIFIAVNLPEEIKKKLTEYQYKWPELPARWVKPENIHITLAFLGYLSDEELPEVIRITKETAQKHNSFSINLTKIRYGPPDKMPPRMIWIEGACPELVGGKKIDKLSNLQKDLENSLVVSKISFEPENRAFKLHITLARINQWEFRRIEPEERPVVDEEISLTFEVNSIEVMESQLKIGGAEYTILESCPLKS